MFEKFGRSIPQSLVDAVSRLMSEAKADEPAAPDADAIARRKRLQALKDKQEDERAERGEKSDDKPAVRKVSGSAYGGAKQKDDDLEEETDLEESRGHKIIANKLRQIDRMSSGVAPDHSTNVQSTKDKLKDAANIKKVEIVNQKDTSVKEDKDTVTKDASGKVTSWSHEGDWKKSTGKEGRGKSVHLSDLARRKSEKLAKEEVEPIEELSKKTLASYAKKASSSSDDRSASNLASRAAAKLASDGDDDGEKDDMKSFQRSKGIGRAVDRLAKESFFGDIKKSFADGMKDQIRKTIKPEHHDKYKIDDVKSVGDARDMLKQVKAAGHYRESVAIDELKASTLTSYVKKAGSSLHKSHAGAKKDFAKYDDTNKDKDLESGEKHNAKFNKRLSGVFTAAYKLNKKKAKGELGEEVELDESSKYDNANKEMEHIQDRISSSKNKDDIRELKNKLRSLKSQKVLAQGTRLQRDYKKIQKTKTVYEEVEPTLGISIHDPEFKKRRDAEKKKDQSPKTVVKDGKRIYETEDMQETATLDQYIKSLGYDPLNMEKNKKVMYSKTNAFKSYASRSEGASPGQDVDTSINPNATARG